MNRQSTRYLKLCDDLQSFLVGHKLDDVIPALGSILAHAFAESGKDKKKCVAYVVGTIDYVFERKQNESNKH